MTIVPIGHRKRILDGMDCDCFIGKLCRYKSADRSEAWFLVLGRSTQAPFDFPVYIVMYESGRVNENAAFDRDRIEEVKL